MTQKQALLKEFKKGKVLNWATAFYLVGTSKLSTRVGELIKDGHDIKKKKVNFKTKYGTRGYYYNYKLESL